MALATADINDSFPGFLRATPENLSYEEEPELQLTGIRPLGDGYTITPADTTTQFGFTQFHFLELTNGGDGFEAMVCVGDYAHFMKSPGRPGKFVSVVARSDNAQPYGPGAGVRPVRLALSEHDPRVGPAPSPVTTSQKGPAFAAE